MLIDHHASVVVLARFGPEVAVVVQPRPGAGGQTTELPAGCLEPGETPLEAAMRELREECSLAAARWRELGEFWAAPAYSTERVTAFEATGLSESPGSPDADEEITVQWRRLEELPAVLSDATSMAGLALWLRTRG
jgi:ADP-ribose pyrophosphatase